MKSITNYNTTTNSHVAHCPVCGGDKFVYDYNRGEVVCAICGTVVAEKLIDPGPEWRAIEADEKMSRPRAGAPATRLTAEAFMTTMDNKDALGNMLDPKRKLEATRLRRWQNKVQTSYERDLVEISKELERLGNIMGLPKACINRALEIYRAAASKGLNRGWPTDAMAAAVLYAACRMLKTPRPFDEFVRHITTDRGKMTSCYRLIVEELKVKMPANDPMLHMSRIAGQLGLSGDVVKTAIEILQKAKRDRQIPQGKGPAGLAAAALYLAARIHGIERSQRDFAMAAGVAEVTVRNNVKLLSVGMGVAVREGRKTVSGSRVAKGF